MSREECPAPHRVSVETATVMMSEAIRAQADNAHERAHHHLDRLLLMIGDAYRSPRMIDETGQKLALAAIEAKRGRDWVAVALKRRAAEARLEMLQQAQSGG